MVFAPFGRRACLVVVLGMIPASLFAQGTSTAIIAGVIRDASGAVLPGVTIEAASPALIEKVRSTVSDDRGQYRLPELRPGVYTVTFSLPGFATVTWGLHSFGRFHKHDPKIVSKDDVKK